MVVVAACAAPVLFVREDGGHGRVFEGVRAYLQHSWKVFHRDPDVRSFLIANTAWEGVRGRPHLRRLYLTVGLRQPLGTTTAVLAAVAAGYIVAAAGSGFLGDRFGLSRVIAAAASVVYGLGLVLGGFGNEWQARYLPVIFVVAIAGGTVMTLAWGLLFKLMPPADRGAISGLATTTGIGLLTGPLLAGAAIDLLSPYLEDTDGYQALWPILGIPVLLVIPLVVRLSAAERKAGTGQPESPEPIT